MTYSHFMAAAIGAVMVGLLLLGLEHFRARKPKLYARCGATLSSEPKAPVCSLPHGHSGGVHGAKSGKTNIWWEDDA